MRLTRRRSHLSRSRSKQRGGGVYTYSHEFPVALFMKNEGSDAYNTYVDLSALPNAELEPLAKSILHHLQEYAQVVKNANAYPFPFAQPGVDPAIAGFARNMHNDADTVKQIIDYVDNITYRHIAGNRFEVEYTITIPDSPEGEPNLGFSNDDKEAQRDNIFESLINPEFADFSTIEYGGEYGWNVLGSLDELDYYRFNGPFVPPAHNDNTFTNANQLLIGAEDLGIIPKPADDKRNALSFDEFHEGEAVVIISEGGHDHMYKRDGILAYFTYNLEQGSEIIKNPNTNNEIIRKHEPLPVPPVFKNGITFKTGVIGPAAAPPHAGGRRRVTHRRRARQQRRRQSRRSRK